MTKESETITTELPPPKKPRTDDDALAAFGFVVGEDPTRLPKKDVEPESSVAVAIETSTEAVVTCVTRSLIDNANLVVQSDDGQRLIEQIENPNVKAEENDENENGDINNEDDDEDEDLFGGGDDGAGSGVAETENKSTVTESQTNDILREEGGEQNEAEPPNRAEAKTEEYNLKIPRKSESLPDREPPIPRKSSSNGGATLQGQPSMNTYPSDAAGKTPGFKYGLPDGVFVPASIVRSRLLEAEMASGTSKLMDTLKSLPVNLINDALTEYDDAVDIKGSSSIRNHGAYLYGVVKRYVGVHVRAMAGEGTGILPMGDEGLTTVVQKRLEQLVSSGFCTDQEMNEKIKSKIRMLAEKDALFALDELSSVPRSSIRNFGSYFMGIINRYMRGDNSSHSGAGNISSGSSNQHLPVKRDRFHRDNSSHPVPNSSSFRPRDDRGFVSSNTRFDATSVPPAPPYHTRQQPRQNQQQPMAGMNYQQTSMGSPTQSNRLPQSHVIPGPPGPSSFQPQQRPPPSYMQIQQQYMQQPGYNPQQGIQSNAGMFQPSIQPSMMGAQQQQYSSQQQYNNPNLGNQQPHLSFMQQQQQPSSLSAQQVPMYAQGQMLQQVGWNQQQSSAPPISVDILGLADKAASAVQAFQQQRYPQQQAPQQQMVMSQYGISSMGSTQPVSSFTPQQPQQYMQPQQPLSFRQDMSGQSVATQNRGSAPISQYASGGRRRTTAKLSDLPPSVQYAIQVVPCFCLSLMRLFTVSQLTDWCSFFVQNLVATGAVESIPDEGIMGMIFDLPEPLALASIQKFVSIDKSSMRNKTAYLAGVLRRELEKIHRR
jgi:hypothetical protein